MLQILLSHPAISVVAILSALFVARRIARSIVNRFTSDVHLVPKPSGGSWIWGHELEPWTKSCGEVYSEWIDKHGPVVRMSGAFGHDDILAIADPAALSYMFTRNVYGYTKSPLFRPLIDRLLGRSLVWAEGDDHKRMRTLLNPVFTAEQTRGMYEDVKVSTDRMILALTNHVNANGGDVITNIPEWNSRATLDIIGRVGFGHDFGCGETPEAQKIASVWQETVNMGMTKGGQLAPIIIRTFPIITSLPIPAIQAQGAIKLTIKALAEQLFVKALNDPESIKGKDLLSTLIRANIREGRNISKDELLDHICTFVMVGHETTAGVLNYTLHALAQNPDVQDKLRRELIEFGTEPTYNDFLTKLPYLDAVTKEGLRMFPPSSHTERIAVNDDVLPLRKPLVTPEGKVLNSLRIKKGQVIHIPALSLNRNNAVWGDGWTFRPERWITPGQLPAPSELTQGWSQLFSFVEGPRMCIGYRLALLEYKIILSSLVKAFVFYDTGAQIESVFSATLQPKIVGKEGTELPLRVALADN